MPQEESRAVDRAVDADETPFILFADDDPETLEIFCAFAASRGWRCDTAATAREIIAKVNYHCKQLGRCYDVIVTDVNFFDNQPGPRISGISAVGQIRAAWPDLPVIFYTGYLNTIMKGTIDELGNTEAIEKMKVGPDGRISDVVSVIKRIEMVLRWRKQPDSERRTGKSQAYDGPKRRGGDCRTEVRIPPVLESALEEGRALRELHAAAGGRSQNKSDS